ncbi:MAG TPA: hypothetical protein PKJ83_16675 [Cyclobacteriaceae bacterium]|nr:hypothetical protein [Cyclobacteriaceae bacterium]
MKAAVVILISLFTGALAAQTPVNKVYPVTAGQKISLRFDYPELVKISTWDKNEISITGSVSINGGENDDAFELFQSTSGNMIYIENKIRNLKELPHRITVTNNGEKITFKTKADYQKYCEEHGRNFNQRSEGVDMDILLEVKVPMNIEAKLESVYGIVEVKNYTGPLTVEATYGGVDVTVQEKTMGELRAETNYGQIYSNLDLKFSGSEFKDFHTQVSAKLGSGPRYSFESKYGNVYLRKAL